MLVSFNKDQKKKLHGSSSSLQPNVDFGKALAKPVRPASRCKMAFNFIKGPKKLRYGVFICLLCGSNAAFIHAVVNVIVMPSLNLINLTLQRFRV